MEGSSNLSNNKTTNDEASTASREASSTANISVSSVSSSRKRVPNPYAKAKLSSPYPSLEKPKWSSSFSNPVGGNASSTKSAVRNPYRQTSDSGASHQRKSKTGTPRESSPLAAGALQSSLRNVTPAGQNSELIAPRMTTSRPTPISRSLSVAERLPSRNLSFGSAEILTVGELYRFLYQSQDKLIPRNEEKIVHENDTRTTSSCVEDGHLGKLGASPAPALKPESFKEIESVRITGVLLCVDASPNQHNEGASGATFGGTFILVGDPLERIRPVAKSTCSSLKKKRANSSKLDPVHDASSSSGSDYTSPAPAPSSVLRNKNSCSLATCRAQPGSIQPPSPNCSLGDAGGPILKEKEATTPLRPNLASGADAPTTPIAPINHSRSKSNESHAAKGGPIGSVAKRGGILSNKGKKRLVYSGSAAKGTSSFSSGGVLLGGRKFITPRRVKLMEPTPGTGKVQSVKFGKLSPSEMTGITSKNPLQPGAQNSCDGTSNNPKPEIIINRHLSPVVPVWIGYRTNGDGLDNSVIGDLVMVMGEVVTEHCPSCKDVHGDFNHEPDDRQSNHVGDHNHPGELNNDDGSPLSAPPSISRIKINNLKDAAKYIAARASKQVIEAASPSSLSCAGSSKHCCQCIRFIRARFVKNANGTDMNLQREALRVRRDYIFRRKKQMESIFTDIQDLYSSGFGPVA